MKNEKAPGRCTPRAFILHIRKKHICSGTGTEREKKEELKDAKNPIIWKDGRAYKRRAGGHGRRGAGDGCG